jgi:formiminotetrahydrofolate cyclodeaminase
MNGLEQLSELATRLSLADPPEGAGVLAAGVAEMSAALCESLARNSLEDWCEARGLVIQAATIRARARSAGDDNARSYSRARTALTRPGRAGETGRDAELRADLIAAAETLLRIAAVSADCVSLAATLAGECRPEWRPDAAGAAELAAGAAVTAAGLIDINLALLPEDERRQRARVIVAAAEVDRHRARASGSEV